MNTVSIGDRFEEKCHKLIKNVISSGELGIIEGTARLFKQKGYYSNDREGNIIFDLSIEIWPPNAERYSLLFLIECKSSSSKKVPVDDVEEFYSKVIQVSGLNIKGIMISDNSFQSGGIIFAKNQGMMLIDVDHDNSHSVILHKARTIINNVEDDPLDEIINSFFIKTFGTHKVEGLKKFSSDQIEDFVDKIIFQFNNRKEPVNLKLFTAYLESEYGLTFDYSNRLETVNRKQIEGYYDIKNKRILIDRSIYLTKKFSFILGHEIGHFFLHNELKINQEIYNDFKDSEYNPFIKKYELLNDKNWIEWQANKFAISLLLPKRMFLREFISFRNSIGVRKPNHIYLDDQRINKNDYYDSVNHLSRFFNTTNTSIRYRIEELKLISYKDKDASFSDTIEGIF